jgi:predicted esterase YcpF (UPF0227 family)
VLLNPSVNPTITLQRAIHRAENFYDSSYYEWNEKHIDMLKEYHLFDLSIILDKILLMVQKGDELLDYKEAVQKYKDSKINLQDGGNHSFEGIEKHFDMIREYFGV